MVSVKCLQTPEVNALAFEERLGLLVDGMDPARNQPGWILPSAQDFASVKGNDGATRWFPDSPTGWFWASDKKRVTLETGISRDFDPQFKVQVVCVRKL